MEPRINAENMKTIAKREKDMELKPHAKKNPVTIRNRYQTRENATAIT